MNTMTGSDSKDRPPLYKSILLVVLGAAAVLLVPLIAMQFTREVVWTPMDFVAAAVLLIGAGLMYLLPARLLRTTGSRIALGVVVAIALVLVWAELAVGIFGTPFAGT
ncbi:hypothetical protein [Massilia eurypsychrophila]|nr:hypothetical protein [Massilia eurypsychrophila]